MTAYAHVFLPRHSLNGPLLRATPYGEHVESEKQIARGLAYFHRNPVTAKITSKELAFPWSSAREFAGLSVAGLANVERVKHLMGGKLEGVVQRAVVPHGLDHLDGPAESLDLIVSAAAAAVCVAPDDVLRMVRQPRPRLGRALAVALADVEGHLEEALAAYFGVTAKRIEQLRASVTDDRGVRIARSFLRWPSLRAGLKRPSSRLLEAIAARDRIAGVRSLEAT
jgi:hypothetical protein